ncbi:MAG: M14 family zinc carboxypeptidase [Candidatus Cloacimonetes bacterium]|nr:M14 family zinc carboxypeptidase [Candidatus Cloacimonadota bacterium]
MKYLILTVLIFCICLSVAATTRFVVRLNSPSPESLTYFQNNNYDICSYKPGVYLDVLLGDSEYQALLSQYPRMIITQTEADLKANLSVKEKDIPGYRNYQNMVDELMVLQAEYPSLMQVSSLGESWATQYRNQGLPAYQNYNHQVWAVKLSNNVSVQEDEPAFYFVGAHHAREPISMETVMAILVNLLEGYGTDATITDLVNTSEIWFVPLLNPDGHKIVLDQTDVWWRKNLRDNNANEAIDLGSDGSGPDGIDINRNYGYKWGYLSASGNPNSITYHGLEPFSELETQYFKAFLESRNFLAGISYHTYGEYVLYPFGYMYNVISPDIVEIQALANSMAATIPSVTGAGTYTPMHSYELYPVSGSLDDWAYGERGIFAYTIEMATEFIPNATQVPTIIGNNLEAAKLLLSRKNTRTLRGHVTDAYTGQPLSAMVFVSGIDDNSLKTKQIWSDAQFGSFYRFLPQGTHTVHYICPGYQSEVRSVPITNVSATVEDIALIPVEPINLQVNIVTYGGTPLAGAVFSFIDLDNQTYTTDAAGQISIANFYPGVYRYSITHNGSEQLMRMEDIQGYSLVITLSNVPDFLEDFDTDLTSWQTSGSWGRSTTHYNGSHSLADSPSGNYSSNSNSTCKLISPINLTGLENANLQFYAKFNIALDGDYCELAYSTNGTTWKYFTHFNGVSDWQLYTYSLNHLIGQQVYFRFKLSSNYSGNADGIYIDDFKAYTTANATDLEEGLLPSAQLKLGCYPNPFSDIVTFSVVSPDEKNEPYSLAVFNLKGQLVNTIQTATLKQGSNKLMWDGRDFSARECANGIYFARLMHKGHPVQTIKTVLIK